MFARTASLLVFASCLLSQAQTIPATYQKYCAACHADSATGTDRGPGLIATRSLRSKSAAQIRDVILKGTNGDGYPGSARN